MRKVIFLLLFPFIAQVLVSCCNCIETTFGKYTNKLIEINNLDNSGPRPQVSLSGAVVKEAFGIRVRVFQEETAFQPASLSLFQAANAFSCGCPPPYQFLPKDSITAIRIITINDFDESHPAESDVSGFFRVYEWFSFSTLEDFLRKKRTRIYDLSSEGEAIDLLLMTPPRSGIHRFRVEVVLSDGRILEEFTDSIELI